MVPNEEVVKKVLDVYNFDKLNPVQELAIKNGLLNHKNIIIAAPTASGKTLCAAMLALNSFFNEKKKTLYLCPLVALAQEHYSNFKEKFSRFGIKVALSIGDFDSSDPWLRDYDLIVCSNEKADSLIRHGADWIKDVGVVIADEIHLLNDVSRGPTLEILLTRLREMNPTAKIIGLSATISNVKELSSWLKGNSVVSNWRPVKLYEGVSYNSSINFLEKDSYKLNENLEQDFSIVENTLEMKKQLLIFVATRRNAEALAERLIRLTKQFLTKEDKSNLEKLSEKILNVLEIPTKQCRKLSNCVKNGVAFHHAGLLSQQKKIIENEFRKGLIKAIVATPTLAMGVNLPAFRVMIRDAKRYYAGYGSRYIPVMEYKQFVGRAGRPQYDEFGESVLIAKSESESEEFIDRYIQAEPEEIQSKLSLEPVLRMHTLALIASDFVNSEKDLLKFFEKTFFSHQYGNLSEIKRKLERIIDMLIEFQFLIKKDNKLHATKLGKRISELYLDPITGNHFVKTLTKATKGKPAVFSYLQVISQTAEMQPLLSVRSKDIEEIEKILVENDGKFLTKVPEEWDIEYDDFMKTIKTGLVFYDWANELTEDQILNKHNMTPGELRTRLTNADWLLYSTYEIALLLGYKELLNSLKKLRVRMKYGIREELIPLVRLENVGRVRARKLFTAGLRSLEDLRKATTESIAKIVGPTVAQQIKKQLGEKEEKQTVLSEKGE